MTETLTDREWVIGVYDYRPIADPPNLFAAFYETVSRELSSLGLEITHVAIEGGGYTGKAQKAGGAAHKRLLDSGFCEITVLGLICNPPKSRQPAYDRFVSASLSIAPHNDALLCFAMNDGLLGFGSEGFHRILEGLTSLHSWGAGYAFVDAIDKQPEFHVMGLDNGELPADELDVLTKWYCSTPECKMTRIRSVYPGR